MDFWTTLCMHGKACQPDDALPMSGDCIQLLTHKSKSICCTYGVYINWLFSCSTHWTWC